MTISKQNLFNALGLSFIVMGLLSAFAGEALAATAPTTGSITFSPSTIGVNSNFSASWSANNSPTSYIVKVDSTIYNMGTVTTWTGTPASLSLAIGNHIISAQACNLAGCSPWTAGKTLTVTSSAPTTGDITFSPTSVAANTKFTASWYANNNPTAYNIKIDANIYKMGSVTTWTGTPASLGLTAGTHQISGQACNNYGCSPWTAGKTLVVTSDVSTGTIAPTTGDITFSPTSVATNTKFTASWSANNSPTAYNIKIDETVFNMGTTTTWTGTPANLGLAVGTHLISGQACNSAGCSLWTTGKTLTVTPVSSTGTLAPTTGGITFSPTSVATNDKFTASWSANNKPTSYKIKVDANVYDMGASTMWTGTPASLGLTAGTHQISGQACNSAGCSLWTTGKTLTVTPATVLPISSPSSSPTVSYSEMSNASCVDLSQNLSRGAESASVLSLQNFLLSKGLLATQPTSFYGNMTVAAVKAYQRSIGLTESGMVYELTRQAIKKETCSI